MLLFGIMMAHQPMLVSPASAGLTATSEGGHLYPSCRADNDCVLAPIPVGEEVVSGQSSANSFQQEVLTFEFVADPPQEHIVLLSDMLSLLEIDFRHQTEAGSFFRPALDVRLILGQNVNDWSFDASLLPDSNPSPYTLENEQLDLSEGRVLWENEPIRLVLTITLDRPGTWEFNMRGASVVKLDIPWSIDADDVDSDEPSSTTQPRETLFEEIHRGALVGADHDCWSFEVETHEVLRLFVEWELVPIEVEQPHPVPDLITAAGRLSPAPEVVVDDDGESLTITYRWRALPTGDYTLCMHGSPEKIQPYVWSGAFGYESMGPTDPSGFGSASYYPQGAATVGDASNPFTLHGQGFGLLVLSILTLVIFVVFALRPTTSYGLRFGMFVPGVLMLMVGGILHPLWAIADEVQHDDEMLLEDLIDMRLQQLWDVSAEGVPEQTLATHTGATWGMLDGEQLKLKLTIEQALPLDDGRWQLVVPELESLRLDEAIFGQVAKGQTQQTQQGMLESQTVRFVLLAGRSLLLDLLMLEALLVVDEFRNLRSSISMPPWSKRKPQVRLLHLHGAHVRRASAIPIGCVSKALCFLNASPSAFAIVTSTCWMSPFLPSDGFDGDDVPEQWDIRNADGLLPYGSLLMWCGFLLGIVATSMEVRRSQKAHALASSYRVSKGSDWG